MQPNPVILRPADFRPKYGAEYWLDKGCNWERTDAVRMLTAGLDMQLTPIMVADALGRPPTTCARKARELRLWLPPGEWRRILPDYGKSKRGEALLNFNYPYIAKPDDRHADLIAVNRLISNQLPGREDVCQDIMLALWQSKTSLDELRADPKALRAFISSFRKQSYEKGGYGVESMDVTIYSPDGDGKSKYEDRRYQDRLWARG